MTACPPLAPPIRALFAEALAGGGTIVLSGRSVEFYADVIRDLGGNPSAMSPIACGVYGLASSPSSDGGRVVVFDRILDGRDVFPGDFTYAAFYRPVLGWSVSKDAPGEGTYTLRVRVPRAG